MKNHLFILICILFCHSGSGQSSQHLYGGGFGNKLSATSDGGYILTGQMQNSSFTRCFVMKFDSISNPVWLKNYYDLLEFYSTGNDITELPGEGYLLNRAMYHDTISNLQISLIKCNYTGDVIWAKSYGNVMFDDEAGSVTVLSDGYLLAGYTTGYGPGGEDFVLIKTDTSGNILWTKNYGTTRDEHGVCVIPYQGGYVFGGYCETAGSGTDIMLLHLDLSGNIISTTEFTPAGDQRLSAITSTSDGGLLIAGSTGTGFTNVHSLYIKLSATGLMQWSKMLPDYYSVPSDIKSFSDGIVSTGIIYHQANRENSFIMRMDSVGTITGQDYFGDSTGCQIASSIRVNDTMICTGSFIKPTEFNPSVYLSRYLANDTACNHYTENFTTQPFSLTVASPTWQTDTPSFPESDAIIVATDAFTTDTNVCDFTPATNDFEFDKNISVYPIPAHTFLNINFSELTTETALTIYTLSGTIIKQEKNLKKNNSIVVSDILPGVYTLEIKTSKAKSMRKLIIN